MSKRSTNSGTNTSFTESPAMLNGEGDPARTPYGDSAAAEASTVCLTDPCPLWQGSWLENVKVKLDMYSFRRWKTNLMREPVPE